LEPTTGTARGLRRTRDLLTALARSDMRMRYGRGRIRVLKWLLDPVAALGIYLALVAILDRESTAPGLSLACAIVPFQILVTSVLNALQAVHLRGSIIVNMSFPRTLIPLSSVATESVAGLASFTMLPAMMIVYGIEPTAALLWLPVAVFATVALAVALAYPATLFGVWYPELVPFVVSMVRALFFLAPGLIALDLVTGAARDVMPFNPFTGIFESFRHALLYGDSPPAWELLAPLGAAALILALAMPLYRREQAHVAKLVG
jgi:lipopolysaccharide transport system permease protein